MPLINVQTLLAGAIAKIELADWVADYAASSFVDQGALKNISFEAAVEAQGIEADNALMELGEFDQSQSASLKAALMQHDLRKMAVLMGKPSTDVVVTPYESGVTDGKAVMGFGTLPAKRYLTAKLTLDPVSLKPGYTEDPTTIYEQIIVEIARCTAKIKTSEGFAKNKVWEFPFELKAFWDSTVTTEGHEIYRITQIKPQ